MIEKASHQDGDEDFLAEQEERGAGYLRQAVARLRAQLEHPETLQGWEGDLLRRQTQALEVGEERTAALALADEVEAASLLHGLQLAVPEPISGMGSLPRVLRRIRHALERLGRLTPELAHQVRGRGARGTIPGPEEAR